jgi:RNA polymerase sigma factor (sigma-70 family)
MALSCLKSQVPDANLSLRRRAGVSRPAQPHPETVDLPEQMPAPSSIEAALASHQMNTCVQHKLTLLPESQRTVLWLFDMEGMTQPEIAEVLGISIDNVEVRLHRARKRLKQILQTHRTLERDERDVLVCEPVRPLVALLDLATSKRYGATRNKEVTG